MRFLRKVMDRILGIKEPEPEPEPIVEQKVEVPRPSLTLSREAEERIDRRIAEAEERIRRVAASEKSTLRFSGQSVPEQTHGRPVGSFTGPGMRKLRRFKKSRVHEKQMGVDHSLTMNDVEPRKRRRY